MGYIPRPPNAFMLFRADFVRQKHVPGSIETNHGSLSKIIGNCWRSLPLEEKHVWEVKAKHAKAEHKKIYPEYRFRPVHNKNKEKKEKPLTTPDDERRCEEVAQLLLEGKKGDELAAAVRSLDRLRTDSPDVQPNFPHRRSSSVPLPDYRYNGIALPALPFLTSSRLGSPVDEMTMARMMMGQRRASSAQPFPTRSWTMPGPSALARDNSPLPDVDTSLFDPSFLDVASNFGFHSVPAAGEPFNFGEFLSSLPPNTTTPNDLGMSPLEGVAPHELLNRGPSAQVPFSELHPHPELDPLTWLPMDSTRSDPSSTYSGSPSPSETSLPVHAPKPQHASAPFEMWPANDSVMHMQAEQAHEYQYQHSEFAQTYEPTYEQHGGNMNMAMDFSQSHPQPCGVEMDMHHGMQQYGQTLDTLFEPSYCAGDVTGHVTAVDYQYNDMIHEYH